MVKLTSALSRLHSIKALVIGDLMLDAYTIGKARRISPEAPVAVVHVQREEHRPGGAGNVVLNLVSLGAEVVVLGRVGKDTAGENLIQSFHNEKISTHAIFTQDGFKTPVKNRIIADNQQVVRIDFEKIETLPEQFEQVIIEALPSLIKQVNIVALSDYGKGLLTPTLLSAIVKEANALNIPIISDPKGHDFTKYLGSTVIKPNLSEAYTAANLPSNASLENVAAKILQMTHAKLLMITRSEAGISLFEANGQRHDFPVHAKEIKDVTGAGDTVLAMFTFAVANGLSYSEAAQLCNVAAGIAIERIGCAQVSLADIAHRLLERDVTNKIFDEEHLFALQEILKINRFNLLVLSSVKEMNQFLFNAIRQMAEKKVSLLIFITDAEPYQPLIDILSSLKEVDFILLHQESLRLLCSKIQPFESYIFEQTGLKLIENIQQFLESTSLVDN